MLGVWEIETLTNPLQPWVAVEKKAWWYYVLCMAVLEGACSHIAALLFTLDANSQIRKGLSGRSLACHLLLKAFLLQWYRLNPQKKCILSIHTIHKYLKIISPDQESQGCRRKTESSRFPTMISTENWKDYSLSVSIQAASQTDITSTYNAVRSGSHMWIGSLECTLNNGGDKNRMQVKVAYSLVAAQSIVWCRNIPTVEVGLDFILGFAISPSMFAQSWPL